MDEKRMITVLGPTATGKTTLAVHLAALLDGEIISADSRQFYRGMDIGTGKDLEEYVYDGKPVPYHLIDIADAGYAYNLFEYQRDAARALQEVEDRGRRPILCGGSGLYLESILKGYRLSPVPKNPALRERLAGKSLEELAAILSTYHALHNTTDTDTEARAIRGIEIADYYTTHPATPETFAAVPSLIVGIAFDREERRARITERLHARLEAGMVDEVKRLLDSGIAPEKLLYYGLEYKYITLYLTGACSYETMVTDLNTAIHRFAKRQMTWFRKMERDGFEIHWLDGRLPIEEKVAAVMTLLGD